MITKEQLEEICDRLKDNWTQTAVFKHKHLDAGYFEVFYAESRDGYHVAMGSVTDIYCRRIFVSGGDVRMTDNDGEYIAYVSRYDLDFICYSEEASA